MIGSKPLRIGFDKVCGIIKVYDGTRHLLLFGPEIYDQFLIKIKKLLLQYILRKNVNINNINMIIYDRIDFSEGLDVNKTIESKECDVCHHCYFLDKRFRFQPHV